MTDFSVLAPLVLAGTLGAIIVLSRKSQCYKIFFYYNNPDVRTYKNNFGRGPHKSMTNDQIIEANNLYKKHLNKV